MFEFGGGCFCSVLFLLVVVFCVFGWLFVRYYGRLKLLRCVGFGDLSFVVWLLTWLVGGLVLSLVVWLLVL